jgi:hypothetical protein
MIAGAASPEILRKMTISEQRFLLGILTKNFAQEFSLIFQKISGRAAALSPCG